MTSERRFVVLDDLFRMPSTSHAVVVGPHVWVQGLLGTRGAGIDLVPGGVAAETSQACTNLVRVLRASGAGPEHIVSLDVLLLDTADFLDLDRTLSQQLPIQPARTVAYVHQLPVGARVEITAEAHLGARA